MPRALLGFSVGGRPGSGFGIGGITPSLPGTDSPSYFPGLLPCYLLCGGGGGGANGSGSTAAWWIPAVVVAGVIVFCCGCACLASCELCLTRREREERRRRREWEGYRQRLDGELEAIMAILRRHYTVTVPVVVVGPDDKPLHVAFDDVDASADGSAAGETASLPAVGGQQGVQLAASPLDVAVDGYCADSTTMEGTASSPSADLDLEVGQMTVTPLDWAIEGYPTSETVVDGISPSANLDLDGGQQGGQLAGSAAMPETEIVSAALVAGCGGADEGASCPRSLVQRVSCLVGCTVLSVADVDAFLGRHSPAASSDAPEGPAQLQSQPAGMELHSLEIEPAAWH